jgi:hypothetical protein
MKRINATHFGLLLSLGLVACAGLPLDNAPSTSTTDSPVLSEPFSGPMFPAGAKLDSSQSLMMGASENWVGRAVLILGQSSATAYNFFSTQYPQQGWSLISAVRGKTSLLVFTKAERSATVEISDGSVLSNATAVVTVTSKDMLGTTAPKPSKP